jgi:hypothetical protein
MRFDQLNKKTLLVIVAVTALLGTFFFLSRSKPKIEPKRIPETSPKEAQLSQEVAALRGHVRALTARVMTSARSSSGDAEMKSDATQKDQKKYPAFAISDEEITLQSIVHYENILRNEPKDREWSVSKENAIIAFLDSQGRECCTIELVDCRSSICKVVVKHNSMEQQREFLRLFHLGPLKHGGFFHSESDFSRTTLFAARMGYPLQNPTFHHR